MKRADFIVGDAFEGLGLRVSPALGQAFAIAEASVRLGQADAKAACRAAVEKQLIHGALSLQGKTVMEQADAVLAAIDAVEIR